MECPECRSEIRDDSHFCRVCGTRLHDGDRSDVAHTQAVPRPPGDLMIGSSFLGRYKIVEELGRGGMGVVYKAEDTKLRRHVALKFLPPDLTRDPRAKERFVHEARAASALDHPNICIVHEIDETGDGQIFISMGCYEGETLKDKIEKGPLDVAEAVDIAIQVAEGLEDAHEKSIVHRDIKPSNIMVTAKGQAKIMDFGLAKLAGQTRLTKAGTTMGTIAYMSPEQARGEDIDRRTDIWSLGVVLYELLTGEQPFKGEYDQAVIYSILNEDHRPVTEVNRKIPSEIGAIVDRCLEKGPGDRYQAAGELAGDLSRSRTGTSALKYGRRRGAARPLSALSTAGVLKAGIPVAAAITVAIVLSAVPAGRQALRSLIGLGHPPPTLTRVALLPCDVDGAEPERLAFCDGLVRLLAADLRTTEGSDGHVWVLPAGKLDTPEVMSPTGVSRAFGINVTVTGEARWSGDALELTLTRNDVDVESGGDTSAEIVRRRRSPVLSDPLANLSTWQDSVLFHAADLLEIGIDREALDELKSRSTVIPGAYTAFLTGVGYYYPFRGVDNLDAAVDFLREAIEQDSTFTMAYAWLGRAYLAKHLATGEQGWVDLALAAVRHAEELDGDYTYARWVDGEIHRFVGRYDEAIRIYDDILSIDGADFWALLSKGKTYRSMDSLDAAAAEFAKAAEADPLYADTYHYLGYTLFMQGRYEDAIEPFTKLVELEPLNPAGYGNLGAAYFQAGRWEEARGVFEEALAIDTTASLCANLGTIYFSEARYVDAAQMYSKALQISGGDYSMCGYLAECHFWIPGQREKAAEYYRQAISLAEKELEASPEDVSLLSQLASYYERLGDGVKARDLLAGVANAETRDPRVLFRIAETYEQLGDRDAALEWVRRALDCADPTAKVEGYPGLRSLRSDARYRQLLQERELGA